METRRAPRVNMNLKVSSRVDREAQQKFSLSKGGNTFEVDIVDISLRGVGVFSKYFLPKGLRIELQIDGKPFGLEEPMEIKGEVRFCNFVKTSQYRCGIMFVNIPVEYEKKIGEFIATYDERKAPRYKLSE